MGVFGLFLFLFKSFNFSLQCWFFKECFYAAGETISLKGTCPAGSIKFEKKQGGLDLKTFLSSRFHLLTLFLYMRAANRSQHQNTQLCVWHPHVCTYSCKIRQTEWLFPVIGILQSCQGAEVRTQEFIMKMSTGDDLLSLLRTWWRWVGEKRTGGKNHGRTSPCMALATVRGCDWHWEDGTRVFGKGWIKAYRHSWLHKNTRSFRTSFYQTRRNELRYWPLRRPVTDRWEESAWAMVAYKECHNQIAAIQLYRHLHWVCTARKMEESSKRGGRQSS